LRKILLGRVVMLLNVLQAVFALAVTLGIIGAAAYAVRRWAPAGVLQLKPAADRRIQVVESLVLDAQHRLVLVRLDREERLVLLGDGRFLPSAESAAAQSSR
jgi:flagellar protein FliO/FliZ